MRAALAFFVILLSHSPADALRRQSKKEQEHKLSAVDWLSQQGNATCSQDIGHCGVAYQACCIGFGADGFPCGCKLQDGTGMAGSDCGTCGTGYAACCIGYSVGGFPCKCDVF